MKEIRIEVEKVSVMVRFPVNEEMPKRATLFVVSQTFDSTIQEYFDDPKSLIAMAEMLTVAAKWMGES